MTTPDPHRLAEAFPFWPQLSDSDKRLLLDNTQIHTYRQGDNVHSGRACTGILLVLHGQLRVFLLSDEGREITLYRLLDRDICLQSASCILKSLTYPLQVDAEKDTELYRIAPEAYKEISNRYAQAGTFLAETVSTRFAEAMWVMEQSLFVKFDRRLAAFLLEQATLDEGDRITLTHDQIARHLGSAREVVSRMLKYFQTEGWVSVSRGGIQLLAPEKLQELSQ